MSNEAQAQPDHDDPQDSATVQALDATMAGIWIVTTRGSTHLWDLDAMTYTRRPGPNSPSGSMLFDGNAMPITRVEAWPAVGDSFFVWYDDPEDPDLLEHYRISSTVRSIAPYEEPSGRATRQVETR